MSEKERAVRSDKKHRFPLRIQPELHNEADVLAFKYRLSLNFLYTEAIEWALTSKEFLAILEREHARRRNTEHGHFTYHRNL